VDNDILTVGCHKKISFVTIFCATGWGDIFQTRTSKTGTAWKVVIFLLLTRLAWKRTQIGTYEFPAYCSKHCWLVLREYRHQLT